MSGKELNATILVCLVIAFWGFVLVREGIRWVIGRFRDRNAK